MIPAESGLSKSAFQGPGVWAAALAARGASARTVFGWTWLELIVVMALLLLDFLPKPDPRRVV
jgi:hypothetical protein